jgi:hypothetical protein
VSTYAFAMHVVFDIDDCICWNTPKEYIPKIHTNLPECRIVDVEVEGAVHAHVFAPHMEHAFDYLLEKNVQIAFFSDAIEERNKPLIASYFATYLGRKEYEKRIKEEQFKVFSRQHLTLTQDGPSIKDLEVVGQGIENKILVEDDKSYVKANQLPFLKGRSVSGEQLFYSFIKNRSDKDALLALNHAYYFLGVLDHCFELMALDSSLTLRQALKSALIIQNEGKAFADYNMFPEFGEEKTQQFLQRGLAIIQRKNPSAHLYECKK